MFDYHHGIKINGTHLWLDAKKVVDFCCISHGHMDHVFRHKKMIATPATLEFAHLRVGKTDSVALNYSQPYEIKDARITLYPAGHILGSAQVLVEMDGLRLLYSGDFNLDASPAAEAIEIPNCDILIMECTFGKPFYRFPPRHQVEEQLINWVQKTLRQDKVPVVVGYVLGKAQEAMKILGEAGFELSVHGSVKQFARIYEQFGIHFGHWEKFNAQNLEGKVVIVPPKVVRNRTLNKIAKKKTIFLTGWAVHPGLKYRYAVDEAIPLSDHADFYGLVEYVRRARPRKIYTTHGPVEFATHLRKLGFDAEPLQKTRQLSFF